MCVCVCVGVGGVSNMSRWWSGICIAENFGTVVLRCCGRDENFGTVVLHCCGRDENFGTVVLSCCGLDENFGTVVLSYCGLDENFGTVVQLARTRANAIRNEYRMCHMYGVYISVPTHCIQSLTVQCCTVRLYVLHSDSLYSDVLNI